MQHGKTFDLHTPLSFFFPAVLTKRKRVFKNAHIELKLSIPSLPPPPLPRDAELIISLVGG